MTDESIARVCYVAIRTLNFTMGDFHMPRWEEASREEKDFFIQGVRQVWAADCDPAKTHEVWMELRRSEGWTMGPKDPIAKTHPSFIPFEELSEFEQAKDHIFAAIVKNLKTLP